MSNANSGGCTAWQGPPKRYQAEASIALEVEGREVAPWAWITPECGTENCLNPDHLRVKAPVHLSYPNRVCIYCGRPGHTKDHLLPRRWSGDAARRWVAVVPACGTCNSLLNDTLTWSITERRALCHERLRKHFRKVLRTVDHTPDELDEYGPTLRDHIEDAMAKKAEVLAMLEWPTDPDYDARALEHSGIEDAWVTGFLVPMAGELLEHVRAAA